MSDDMGALYVFGNDSAIVPGKSGAEMALL